MYKKVFILILVICICGLSIYSYKTYKQEDKTISNKQIENIEIIEEQDLVDVPVVEEETPQEEPVEEKKEEKKVEVNYIAVIKIPKIGLEKGLASKDSYWNNVNRNIQILTESDMPDVDKGNVILAGHSGNSGVSYFRKLNKLQIDDKVSISYNGKEYIYKMVNSYEIEKNGYAHILRNAEKTTLTLITCKHNTNKQLIVICELVEIK